MSRLLERRLIYGAAGWQLLTGLITLFFYSYHLKQQGNHLTGMSPIEQRGIHAIFNNLYTFAVTYALLFIVIALLNLLFTKNLLKDGTIQVKLPFILLAETILFYFLSDYISVLLLIIASIVTLAKNKPIKTIRLTKSESTKQNVF